MFEVNVKLMFGCGRRRRTKSNAVMVGRLDRIPFIVTLSDSGQTLAKLDDLGSIIMIFDINNGV